MMGAILPFLGYYSLSDLKGHKARKNADEKSVAIIDKFVKIISGSEVSDFCLSQHGFLYNPSCLQRDRWLLCTEKEKDIENRRTLESALKENTGRFTIVVPSFSHITKGNSHNKASLNLLLDKFVPVIDAGQALISHGNLDGGLPKIGIETWVSFIKERYMTDRETLSRSRATRSGIIRMQKSKK